MGVVQLSQRAERSVSQHTRRGLAWPDQQGVSVTTHKHQALPPIELCTRFLVIDSDHETRTHVTRVLQRTGMTVDTADAERAALVAIHTQYSAIYLAASVPLPVVQQLIENIKHLDYSTRFVLLGESERCAQLLEREGVLAGMVTSVEARDELIETSALAFEETLGRRYRLATTPPPPQEAPVLLFASDAELGIQVTRQLEDFGHDVHAVQSAQSLHSTLERSEEGHFALALIDATANALEALDVVRQLHATGSRIPIGVIHEPGCEVSEQGLTFGVLELIDRSALAYELPVAVRRARLRNLANHALRFRATHDALTQLYNRDHFLEVLKRAIARTNRLASSCAVVYIDLDDFKPINDRYGHAAGDLVLKAVASNLQQTLRGPQSAARLGGDEFVVLIEDVHHTDDVHAVALRVLTQLSTPIALPSGALVQVHGSLGIAVSSSAETTASDLMEAADTAMFRAKDAGGNQYCVAADSIAKEVASRKRLRSELRLARPNSELYLVFQPQFDVSARAIVSFEALLRWRRPDASLVSPSSFVPMLEQMGRDVEIGAWVLREAAASATIWAKRHARRVRVAVNVTPSQLEDPRFASDVEEVLNKAGLDPSLLEIEVTEATLARNSPRIGDTLTTLAQTGVNIVLDDFGTSYAALNHLKRYPVSGIKLDRPFVQSLATESNARVMVGMIIDLAHQLDMRVAAVGVEQLAQARYLRERRCDVYQGYLFGRPHCLGDTRSTVSETPTTRELRVHMTP